MMSGHGCRREARNRISGWSTAHLAATAVLILLAFPTLMAQQVVINEVDYDQPSTDFGEFIELKNVSGASVDLGTFTVEIVNGSGGGAAVARTIILPSVNLGPGDYFVICGDADQISNCDLDVSPDSNLIQNGAPDAVGLRDNGTLVDTVSYEGSTGAPYTEGSGSGLEDNSSVNFAGISRLPDGTDTNQNNADFAFACVTPGEANTSGASNCASPEPPKLVVNEIDYDQASTDTAEFIEIKNIGSGAVNLSAFELELVNGSGGGAAVYDTIALPNVDLQPGDFFVVCANSANTPNCDLDVSPNTNLIQNGSPDAVAITSGGSVIDTVSYEGSTGAPFTEGSGSGLEDDPNVDSAGISRFPDGTDTDQNNSDLVFACITPGEGNRGDLNNCGQPPVTSLVINEIDYDQSGTDAAEFVEIKNTGTETASLGLITLELVNGTGGGAAVYRSFALPDIDLPAGGFFVVCANAANTPNCGLDVGPDTNLIQNGAPDAVALTLGGNVIDTVSYEGVTGAPFTEGSGAGLVDNPSVDLAGISRFPDGVDTDQNNADLSQRCITPGFENTSQASNCVLVIEQLVINEIDYDQSGTDAAEFVEIKNTGTVALDLSEFEIRLINGSNATAYNTFALPAVNLPPGGYFVVCGNAANVDNCDLDVSPNTNLIQNGSPDAVALFRTGLLVDTVSYEGSTAAPFTEGSGTGLEDNPGLAFAGISRFPDGIDNDQNNVDFIPGCITPGIANSNDTTGCEPPPLLEIFEIQGNGLSSPFDGQTVTTEGNVVIGVSSNGFFMQTPTVRSDADDTTSDGIFVFTSSAPSVAVGDQVDVTGDVIEFNGLTEFSNSPSVSVDGTAPLPDAVVFDTNTPSTVAMAVPDLERFEGMLVEVDGITVGPSNRFRDVPVTVFGVDRPFREPGIEFPGLPAPPVLPVWDGNPELFEMDPNGAGLPNQNFNSLTLFQATGPLTFAFGDYQLRPTALTVGAELQPLPQPARAAQPGELSLATLNMFRLFAGQADRLAKFSIYIRDEMGAPDVIAVQEVDVIETLEALATEINMDDSSLNYTAFLEEGNDVGGIDVGFLVKDTVQVNSVTQVGKNTIFTFDGSLLNDRPPLILDAEYLGSAVPFPFTFMVVHQRSLNGIDDPLDGNRVRLKRFEQALFVANQVQALQDADPDIHLVVAGDFNAFEFTDGFVDVLGQVTGNLDPLGALVPGTDVVDPDLTNQILSLSEEERYTFIFEGNAQVLDHFLTSSALDPFVTGIEVPRANSDADDVFEDDPTVSLRSSDHDGVVLYVQPPVGYCSNLGNSFFIDIDLYKFTGQAGEEVTLRLQADPRGSSTGERATLKLIDAIRGVFLLRINAGDLPNNITATLPADGKYHVFVEEQPRFFPGIRFQGDYCVTIESSGEAASTFSLTPLVEE